MKARQLEFESVSSGIYGGIALGAVIALIINPNSALDPFLGAILGGIVGAVIGHVIAGLKG